MRSFVITSPGLSIANRGSHVTAVELQMDDDALDEFVQAGYAIEVFDDRDEPRSRPAPADTPLGDLTAKARKPRRGGS